MRQTEMPKESKYRKSRFTETQIIGILKSVETGRLVKDVCPKHSVSEATY
ncbi:transposase [Undibacterium sp. LFS511W]|uniref:Transposase n=1 Tax=Undibacterium luofuense TaxID=2828733 RepID=A0A941I6S7_9BURK|nr:transposase [Undibacterium luofuense]